MDLVDQAQRCRDRGLYRAASPSDVLWNLAFADGPHLALPKVSSVDCFISHVAAGSSFCKALALCHYLNFDKALISSISSFIAAVVVMLLRARSYSELLDQDLFHLNLVFLGMPVTVFVVVYFAGHVMGSKNLWFDQVCTSEAPVYRFETLHAIPCFIATSKEMVVLWDETFFERLWCIHEICCFVKSRGSSSIHMLPKWLPLWILVSLCLASAVMVGIALVFVPAKGVQDAASEMEVFLAACRTNSGYLVPSLIAIVLARLFFAQKLRFHGRMLDQMADFEIRSAKCALETDRLVIQRHVVRLFDEALEAPQSVAFGADVEPAAMPLVSPELMNEIRGITSYPTQEEVLDLFNAYVRGPLRASVVDQLGSKVDLSFKICTTTLLPYIYIIPVYFCDGGSCEERARDSGLSVAGYVHLNAFLGLFCSFAFAPVFPMLLRANAFIESSVANSAMRMCLGVMSNLAITTMQSILIAATYGFGFVSVMKASPRYMLGFFCVTAIFGLQFWLFFTNAAEKRSQRGMCLSVS